MVKEVKDEKHFFELISEEKSPVLVDFFADWCEPCKWLDVILEEVDADTSGRFTILKVDIEKLPTLKENYNVRSVPVVAVIKGGEVVWRMNGFQLATGLVERLEAFT